MIDLFLKWSERKFEYGVTDCCQFVGACLQERNGYNPATEFLYLGEESAERLIESYGGMANLLTDRFGEPHSEPQDGDIAMLDDQRVVGFVYKNRIVARASGSGLIDLPTSRATRFWRE